MWRAISNDLMQIGPARAASGSQSLTYVAAVAERGSGGTRQLRAICKHPGNLAVRKSAWWRGAVVTEPVVLFRAIMSANVPIRQATGTKYQTRAKVTVDG